MLMRWQYSKIRSPWYCQIRAIRYGVLPKLGVRNFPGMGLTSGQRQAENNLLGQILLAPSRKRPKLTYSSAEEVTFG